MHAIREDATVLVVEDDPPAAELVRTALRTHAVPNIDVVGTAEDAIARMSEALPDVLVLDLHLPGRSGLDVLETLATNLPIGRILPVITVTGDDDPEMSRRALELGAIDALRKPFDPEELAVRIRNQLELGATVDAMRRLTRLLERDVDDLHDELGRSLGNQLHQLRSVAIMRDSSAAARMERIGTNAHLLAHHAGLDTELAGGMLHAAGLHDIGNVALPDVILNKEGAFTNEERALMQTHTIQGARLLGISPHPTLQLARTIALAHHERWDGRGYPRRLVADDIPLPARIVAIVDVFDSLTQQRPYKEAWSTDRAVEEMERMRGLRFDPDLLDAFLDTCLPVLDGVEPATNHGEEPAGDPTT